MAYEKWVETLSNSLLSFLLFCRALANASCNLFRLPEKIMAHRAVFSTKSANSSGTTPFSHSHTVSSELLSIGKASDCPKSVSQCLQCCNNSLAASSALSANSGVSIKAVRLPEKLGKLSKNFTASAKECSAAKRLTAFAGKWWASSIQ